LSITVNGFAISKRLKVRQQHGAVDSARADAQGFHRLTEILNFPARLMAVGALCERSVNSTLRHLETNSETFID